MPVSVFEGRALRLHRAFAGRSGTHSQSAARGATGPPRARTVAESRRPIAEPLRPIAESFRRIAQPLWRSAESSRPIAEAFRRPAESLHPTAEAFRADCGTVPSACGTAAPDCGTVPANCGSVPPDCGGVPPDCGVIAALCGTTAPDCESALTEPKGIRELSTGLNTNLRRIEFGPIVHTCLLCSRLFGRIPRSLLRFGCVLGLFPALRDKKWLRSRMPEISPQRHGEHKTNHGFLCAFVVHWIDRALSTTTNHVGVNGVRTHRIIVRTHCNVVRGASARPSTFPAKRPATSAALACSARFHLFRGDNSLHPSATE